MSVIRTDKWLLNLYNKPIELCEKIKIHFDDAPASEIYNHLISHGMYRLPVNNGKERIKKLQENNVWEIVKKEKELLQRIWGAPNVPIFIFPSDTFNRQLKQDFNGRSGLAFKDKLFLFISEDNVEQEIRALFTHEYNHVCRLSKFQKDEENYVLLDTIILEGLAENAVRERFGEELLAAWTSYYPNEKLEKIWNNLVLPNRNIQGNVRKYQEILYGFHFYPKMAGYCVGYYLVKKYMEANNVSCKDLMDAQTDKIAKLNNS